MDSKVLLELSKELVVLYVEDEDTLRENTGTVFKNFFKRVDTAVDGVDGLEKYLKYENENSTSYDLVITDINMPKMSGIELSKKILKNNVDQYIIIISAYNEANFYHEAINAGVSGFLTKPIDLDQLKRVFYKASQIVGDHKMIQKHFDTLQALNIQLDNKNKELEETIKKLKTQDNAIETKNKQVEKLLAKNSESSNTDRSNLEEYFKEDNDEGEENVVFIGDDGEELNDLFLEVTECVDKYLVDPNFDIIENLQINLSKISSILLRYTPYLDPLAESFDELKRSVADNPDKFIDVVKSSPESVLTLFDAIAVDMERYVSRFSVESMAMKNIHHIHQPTSLSIKQVIVLFNSEDEDGDIEFF